MSKPATVPLDIYRGDCGHWTLRFYTDADAEVPYDLTGMTVAAEIRHHTGATVLATLDTTVTLPNVVAVDLPAADSRTLTPGRAVWDLQFTDSAACVHTLVAGPVTVRGDVTGSTP